MQIVTTLLAIYAAIFLTGCSVNHNLSVFNQPVADTATQYVQQHQRALHLNSYGAFTNDLQPMLDKMGNTTIVGLGEGTHGTSEFQTVRNYITRYLIVEKGFNTVCLENSFGWCAALNHYIQTGKGNLPALMHSNLLGMWQNAETRALLEWLREYNRTHARKVTLVGMDYSCMQPNAAIVQQISHALKDTQLNLSIDSLMACSALMDAAYADMNTGGKKYKWKEVLQNGVAGYELIQKLKQQWQAGCLQSPNTISINDRHLVQAALYNSEMAFYSIYRPVKEKKEASRDESMAGMIRLMVENEPGIKMVVLAHNAHVARKSIFGDDNNGGGTGSFIESYFPGQYFVAATGTAGGTMSATTDRMIVPASYFKPCTLPAAADSSWEQTMGNMSGGNLYIDCSDKQFVLPKRPLRFTGYRAPDAKDFINVRLNELFDCFVFIYKSHATRGEQ